MAKAISLKTCKEYLKLTIEFTQENEGDKYTFSIVDTDTNEIATGEVSIDERGGCVIEFDNSEERDTVAHGYYGSDWEAMEEAIEYAFDSKDLQPEYFYINGYWKDDKTKFEGYKVISTSEELPKAEDEEIFFHGLDEAAIKKAIQDGFNSEYDFVITSYCGSEIPEENEAETLEHKSIFDIVIEAMQTDGDATEGQQKRVLNAYQEADEATREQIDKVFIALTGYSLQTIIKQAAGYNEWTFIVDYLPNYSRRDDVAENNDLQMIVDNEEELSEGASRPFNEDYKGDRAKAAADLAESNKALFNEAWEAFLNGEKNFS